MLQRVLLVAGGASLLFGLLFVGLYQTQLEHERGNAAGEIKLSGHAEVACT